MRDEGFAVSIRRQWRSEPSFWAGQLSHCGVALVALGLALTANLGLQQDANLAPGDTHRLRWLRPHLPLTVSLHRGHRQVQGATIEVRQGDQLVTELAPRANYFGTDTSGITTPAVHSTWRGDLYLTLLGLDSSGILLRLNTSPGVWLLWLGGLTTAAGGAVEHRCVQEPGDRPVAVG